MKDGDLIYPGWEQAPRWDAYRHPAGVAVAAVWDNAADEDEYGMRLKWRVYLKTPTGGQIIAEDGIATWDEAMRRANVYVDHIEASKATTCAR